MYLLEVKLLIVSATVSPAEVMAMRRQSVKTVAPSLPCHMPCLGREG